ncbi:uncharacterized protein SPPG_07669 [Spizellomyces punctatus DAOM BR117]|uniref:chitin synthase n=1 Tax=Spizellomyces punctatus (strain DAOM BR117) TaxID=645134 RepID=A0A0L0H5P6_SPIPD|nr:uncharacterized protein SPPG_07669 [Spizellomyces punctatus DAOM BR117]KNC96835.1 hypothetical protein SPPG_07669 [Spizellomyces punctatus DAOM BR117]|eukprot:XP_016604875.1 hypothetical protein SPPG_07669 [Spizellomyces punctatus DAOM BR117]
MHESENALSRSRQASVVKSNKIGVELPPSISPDGDGPSDDKKVGDEETAKDTKAAKKAKIKKPKVPQTAARRWWVRFTWLTTWWIPSFLLKSIGGMKSPDVRMAWREKVALCVIILFLCGVMIFFVQFFSKFLCPNANIMSPSEVAQHNTISSRNHLFISWNGYVYDVNSYADRHPDPAFTLLTVAGKDASEWFPRINAKTGALHKSCPQPSGTPPDLPTNTTCLKTGFTTGYCHDTWKLDDSVNVYKETVTFPIYRVASLAYNRNTVYDHAKDTDAWILINGRFYDVTELLKADSWIRSLFPSDLLDYLAYYRGKDASLIANRIDPSWMKCLDNQFFVGVVDDRISAAACHASEYILYGCTGVMVFILVIKFLAALQLGSKRQPENHDRFVIMQVPCYTEGEDSLKKTINSLSLLEYDDTRKLLFIVADGIVQGAGNDRPTPDLVLDILGVDRNVQQPETKDYVAIAEGSKGHNKAKIYSGLYHIQARAIPFIVVVKCGKETETTKPGNRGKRDSQMILMKFLNKVHYRSPMTPLDLEMYHHMKNIIGVHPYLYEYILMVDADTEVVPDSLNRLVACMIHDGKIMGICGETKIANEKQSWVTMMQVYEYYISHHMAKAFESLFGSVTCLPGCFSMYRIRTPEKKIPLLISNDIIHDYEENKVDTLHKKNLLSLGEDRYLTTLMLKYFPEYRTKFTADAKCLTIVPDQMSILLSQRRRWINSTIHNLFELLFLPQLCGCMIFSMRFVVFLDLFATLIMPATTGYLVYLIYAAIEAQEPPIISLIMLGVAYGLQAIIFIIKREYQHVGWMIINILAMPVFSFWLPLYSFWHFDDFSWGNTRRIAGASGKDSHGGDGETFDPSIIPLMKWEDYEGILMQKAQEDEAAMGMSEYGASENGYSVAYGGYNSAPHSQNGRPNGRPVSAYSISNVAVGQGQGNVRRRASVRSANSQFSQGPAHYTRPSSAYGGPGGMYGSSVGPASPYEPSYAGDHRRSYIPHIEARRSLDGLQQGPMSYYEPSQYAPSYYAASSSGSEGEPRPPAPRAINNLRNSALFRSDMALDRLPGIAVDIPPSCPPSQLIIPDATQSSDQLLSKSKSAETIQDSGTWTGGFPTDEDIVERIRYIIAISDLHTLTKRKVREELGSFFGTDLSEKRQFISDYVEAIVTGRL